MVYRVVVLQTSQSFEVNANESVLEAAQRQDVKLAHECTFGGCGTCRVKLVEGTVGYEQFPMALTPEEAEQGYALACQARPQSDLVISAEPAPEGVCEPQRCTAVVKQLRRLTPEVANLHLELPDLPSFDCLPGQYMNVHLGDGTHRSFSMASLPNASRVDPDCPPGWLYWGMRGEAGLYLDQEIRRWTPRLYEFQYVPVLSRASSEWQGKRGHVQDAVLADIGDLSEHSIYMCGSPAMIGDAKQAFLARGADLEHIYSDGFSFQHASQA